MSQASTRSILQDAATPDKLDEFNFRSDARQLGRQYYDNTLENNREIHSFIAHYAELLVDSIMYTDETITTSLHNERVMITVPDMRNPIWTGSYLVTLREDLHYAPDGKRSFVSEFRDALARYIYEVARKTIEYNERAQHPV